MLGDDDEDDVAGDVLDFKRVTNSTACECIPVCVWLYGEQNRVCTIEQSGPVSFDLAVVAVFFSW